MAVRMPYVRSAREQQNAVDAHYSNMVSVDLDMMAACDRLAKGLAESYLVRARAPHPDRLPPLRPVT
jgi:hypothetical protein